MQYVSCCSNLNIDKLNLINIYIIQAVQDSEIFLELGNNLNLLMPNIRPHQKALPYTAISSTSLDPRNAYI